MPGQPSAFDADPLSNLDYKFDWAPLTNGREGATSDWLETPGETITGFTISADAGITVGASAITDAATSVTAWLSNPSENVTHEVSCRITTSAGRTDKRTMTIPGVDR